jgi:hypothetical protein
MAVNTRNNIVTNGLVLYLDAANSKSYVSGSTTWSDVSGNRNSGSLVNGPTFSSANGGSIVFDGVNDYAKVNSFNLSNTNVLSINFWTNFSTTAVGLVFEHSTNQNTNNAFAISLNEWSTGSIAVASHVTTYNVARTSLKLYNDGNWHYVSAIIDRSTLVIADRIKIYVDNILDTTTLDGYTNVQTTNFSTYDLYIDSRAGTSLFMPQKLAQVSIYNRALTQAEITQNYNATKTRFNLT